MTGTADTEAVEFKKIYKLDVVVMPPNKIMRRIDHPDVVYKSEREKFNAVVRARSSECHEKRASRCWSAPRRSRSPSSVSKLLKKGGVKHNVLNADQPRGRGQHHRPGRPPRAGDDRHQHGRPRHRHPARRQPRVPRARRDGERVDPARPASHGAQRRARRYEDALRDAARAATTRTSSALRDARSEATLPRSRTNAPEALGELTEAHRKLLELSPYRERPRALRAGELGRAHPGDPRQRRRPEPLSARSREALEATLLAQIGRRRRPAERIRARGPSARASRRVLDGVGRGRRAARTTRRAQAERARAEYERATADHRDRRSRAAAAGGGNGDVGDAGARRTARAEDAYVDDAERQLRGAAASRTRQQLRAAERAATSRSAPKYVARGRGAARAAPEGAAGVRRRATRRSSPDTRTPARASASRWSRRAGSTSSAPNATRRAGSTTSSAAARGRQGDPGSSRFYLSLEDDLLRIFGADRMQKLMERLGMEEGVPIEHRLITRAIRERAGEGRRRTTSTSASTSSSTTTS